jgi:hypothetical protein
MDPESIVITLNGVPVSVAHNNNKEFTFRLSGEGETELTIAGRDKYGQVLDPPYKPIKFTVLPLDTTPPEIVDDECVPRNGATGVDPSTILKIVLVFSEPSQAK